jgi:hypothetical protein
MEWALRAGERGVLFRSPLLVELRWCGHTRPILPD